MSAANVGEMKFGTSIQVWLAVGVVLVFAEAIVPGLVVIFLGLAALTVAALLHLQFIESLPAQLSTWFIISTFYIFSLRILIMRFYPTDTEKQNIDEDQAMIGKIVFVIDTISAQETGRVRFGETTWTAIYFGEDKIYPGEQVRIVGRENISWIVKKVSEEL